MLSTLNAVLGAHHQKVLKAYHPLAEHWKLHSKHDDGFSTSCRRAGDTFCRTMGGQMYHHKS